MKTRKMLAVLSAIIMGASACVAAVPAKAAELTPEAAEAYKAIIQECQSDSNKSYSLHDLTGDGADELIICDIGHDNVFYTFKNGKADVIFIDVQQAEEVWFNTSNHMLAFLDDTFVDLSEVNGDSLISKEHALAADAFDKSGYTLLGHDYKVTDLSPFEETQTQPVPEEPVSKDWRADYAKTLEQYKKSATYNPGSCYGLYDVDGNGIPELFISPSPYGELGDGDNTRLFSDEMYSYGENGVTHYWGGEDFTWYTIPFAAQVAPDNKIICFMYFLGDGSKYYRVFRKFDAATNTWDDLGMYLYSNDSENGENYEVIENYPEGEQKKLTKEEYESMTADYDAMNWVQDFRATTPVDDTSLLNSWKENSTEPTTPSDSPEPAPAENNTDAWREAYKKKLNDYKATLTDYNPEDDLRPMWDLRDLNGDDIPELIISDGGYHVATVSVFTYTDGELKDMTLDKHSEHEYLGSWGVVEYNDENHLLHFEETYPATEEGKDFSNYYYTVEPAEILQEDFFYYLDALGNGTSQWAYNKNAVSETEYNEKIAPYRAMKWEEIGRKYDFDSASAVDDWKDSGTQEETTEENTTSESKSSGGSSSSGSSSSSSRSTTSGSSSSSSSSSSAGSPPTGETLPIAAGVTALGALAAGFFSKKKKN